MNFVSICVGAAAKFVQALKYMFSLKILEIPGNNINEKAADDNIIVILV